MKAEEETLMAPCLLSLPRGGGDAFDAPFRDGIKITQRAIHIDEMRCKQNIRMTSR